MERYSIFYQVDNRKLCWDIYPNRDYCVPSSQLNISPHITMLCCQHISSLCIRSHNILLNLCSSLRGIESRKCSLMGHHILNLCMILSIDLCRDRRRCLSCMKIRNFHFENTLYLCSLRHRCWSDLRRCCLKLGKS